MVKNWVPSYSFTQEKLESVCYSAVLQRNHKLQPLVHVMSKTSHEISVS